MTTIEQWRQDCVSELSVAHESEVFLKFALLASICGYTKLAYSLELPTSAAEPAVVFYANYANDWQERFLSRHHKHHGPRVAAAKRTNDSSDGSVHWTRDDIWRESRLHQISPQWQRSAVGRAGTTTIVILASREAENDLDFEHTDALVTIASERLESILIQKILPQAHLSLTSVERQFLRWVLDGKSAGEIADIIHISKASAENMQRKLPERFDRKGIVSTAFMAYQMGKLE